MSRIRAIFEKNFDKFELYVNRNLGTIPDDLDQVLVTKQKKPQENKNIIDTNGTCINNEEAERMKKEEEKKEKELEMLREKMAQLEYEKKIFQIEQDAVKKRQEMFSTEIVSKLSFLEQTSTQTCMYLIFHIFLIFFHLISS
jgi:hypothetical protein